MNDKNLETMLKSLNGAVRQSESKNPTFIERFGLRGETGSFGARLNARRGKLQEQTEREGLMQELRDAEQQLAAEHPRLAEVMRVALKVLSDAGI